MVVRADSDGDRCGGMKILGAGGVPEDRTTLPHQYAVMAGQGVQERGISGGSAPGRLQAVCRYYGQCRSAAWYG